MIKLIKNKYSATRTRKPQKNSKKRRVSAVMQLHFLHVCSHFGAGRNTTVAFQSAGNLDLANGPAGMAGKSIMANEKIIS
jgi:hypothetical protein